MIDDLGSLFLQHWVKTGDGCSHSYQQGRRARLIAMTSWTVQIYSLRYLPFANKLSWEVILLNTCAPYITIQNFVRLFSKHSGPEVFHDGQICTVWRIPDTFSSHFLHCVHESRIILFSLSALYAALWKICITSIELCSKYWKNSITFSELSAHQAEVFIHFAPQACSLLEDYWTIFCNMKYLVKTSFMLPPVT